MTSIVKILCVVLVIGGSIATVTQAQAAGDLGQGIRSELASLDFESIIGGPLSAVVTAQAQAARTTVDYVLKIGFDDATADQPNVRMVKFHYKGIDDDGVERDGYMAVPLLTIIPIPYLQFDTADVEFNVKITSTTETSSTSFSDQTAQSSGNSVSVSGSGGGSGSWWGGSSYHTSTYSNTYSSKASYSSQSSTSKSKLRRQYSLRVLVHATQADMPDGMARIVDKMLEIAQAALTGEVIDTGSGSSSA